MHQRNEIPGTRLYHTKRPANTAAHFLARHSFTSVDQDFDWSNVLQNFIYVVLVSQPGQKVVSINVSLKYKGHTK